MKYILLSIVITLLFLPGYSQNSLAKDSCIVVDIFQKAYGPKGKLPAGLICSWKEVKCSDINGTPRITLLRMPDITGDISSAILNLDQLKTLYLSRKRKAPISKLPQEIWQLKKLEHLWLYWGKLDSIPSKIGEFKNLKLLVLEENQLSSLPKALENLKQLEYLSLENNLFYKYPEILDKLASINYLNLSNNPFKSFPLETGKNWKKLIAIYANQIPIENVPKSILDLPHLKVTNFRNSLEDISKRKRQPRTDGIFTTKDEQGLIRTNFNFLGRDSILFDMKIDLLGIQDTLQGKAYKLPDLDLGEETGLDTSKKIYEMFGAHIYRFIDPATNSGFDLKYDYKTNNRTNIIFKGIYSMYNTKLRTLIKIQEK